MRVAMLGLGLIGGSVARAAVAVGIDVSAWSPSGRGPIAAIGDGIRASPSISAAIDGVDIVVLAAPPLACLDLIDQLGGPLARILGGDTIVTDVASTKAMIVDRARAAGLRFVGGHPMAGRETTGYEASERGLLRGKPWVIVPPDPPDPDAERRVTALIEAAGATPIRMSADEHDVAVAMISHLPLVMSAALAQVAASTVGWSTAATLAAGGWESMTRLARGDVDMGAGILATNGAAVADRLRTLRTVVDGWLADLDTETVLPGRGAASSVPSPDAPALRARLAAARAFLVDSDR